MVVGGQWCLGWLICGGMCQLHQFAQMCTEWFTNCVVKALLLLTFACVFHMMFGNEGSLVYLFVGGTMMPKGKSQC